MTFYSQYAQAVYVTFTRCWRFYVACVFLACKVRRYILCISLTSVVFIQNMSIYSPVFIKHFETLLSFLYKSLHSPAFYPTISFIDNVHLHLYHLAILVRKLVRLITLTFKMIMIIMSLKYQYTLTRDSIQGKTYTTTTISNW